MGTPRHSSDLRRKFTYESQDMTKTRTIGQKLYAGASALALLTLALGTVAWISASGIQSRFEDTATKTARSLEYALESRNAFEMARSAQKSLILAGVSGDTAELKAQEAKVVEYLTEMKKSVDAATALFDTDQEKKDAAAVKVEVQKMEQFQVEFLGLLNGGQPTEAFQAFSTKGNPISEAMRARFDSLVKIQREKLQADVTAAQSSYTWTRGTIIGSLLLSVAAMVGFIYLVRGINASLLKRATELGQGATQVSSASSQVASSSQALSQGATEQAASLEETSASMEEMASMTRKNAENSHQAASLMGEVDAQVKGSNAALSDMVQSMASIRESSAKVSKIIKTIDEIAFQTNILALNAAVEAARAGEAGMGFAVVADEVRNLAQRSAQAAKDTASLIEESSSKAQQGGVKVEQVAASITAITDSVGKVKGLVEEVSVASRQQAQGIDQVTQAIAQMEKVTQSTAATAEESAAASEELSAQAEMALESVALLETMVSGERSAQTAAPAATAAPATSTRRRATVITASRTHTAAPAQSPEDILPLEDTGTYGQF
jgi:methyl-accepting chemotaxis protein